MAEFLTTHGVAFQIENVIAGARERVTLVSPFLKLSKTLAERLQDAARRGVPITIVFGKEELGRDQRALLAGLAGARLYFLPNLHAKCYFNEARMVITSMNMYEFSEKNNREMGVLLEAGEPAYADALREVESIIAAAEARPLAPAARPATPAARDAAPGVAVDPVTVVAPAVKVSPPRSTRQPGGVCIRCRAPVPRDARRPLCEACYGVWAAYGNPDYPERWCHACGRAEDTSVGRPLCRSCYHGAGGL